MLSSQASITPSHQRNQSNITIASVDMEAPYTQDANNHQGYNVNGRSLSLDQSMDIQGKVSTNTGYNQQHEMREAQTQESTRPGHYGHPTHSASFDGGQHAGIPDFLNDSWPLDVIHTRNQVSGYSNDGQLAPQMMENKVVTRDVSRMESAQYHMHTPKKQSMTSK